MDIISNLKSLSKLATTRVEDRRREVREETASGIAVVGDQRVPLKDWSAHGFCIGPCDLTQKVGDRMEITFVVNLPDEVLEFTCQTAVMRVNPKTKDIGGVYFNYDEELQERIDAHFEVLTAKLFSKGLVQQIKSAFRRERGEPAPH